MKLKIKKLSPEAIIPSRAYENDAGLDLTALTKEYCEGHISYGTGLAIEIPTGFVGLIFPRSSIYNKDQVLANSVGVIDSSYRGELTFKFKDSDPTLNKVMVREYEVGDRIGQLVVLQLPSIELVEVDELSSSSRGSNGYGSSN